MNKYVKYNQNDIGWSKKFLEMDWTDLLEEWNQQEVFLKESSHPKRLEEDFCRKNLALAMKNWSLSKHSLGMSEFKELDKPSMWLVGENDPKFIAVMEIVRKHRPQAFYKVLEDYGHRIGFQGDNKLAHLITDFITAILAEPKQGE